MQNYPDDRKDNGKSTGEMTPANIANHLARSGRYEEALKIYAEEIARYREAGDKRAGMDINRRIADINLHTGELIEATETYDTALALSREIEDKNVECELLREIGKILLLQGNRKNGMEYLMMSIAIGKKIGNRASVCIGLILLGEALIDEGALDRAGESIIESRAIAEELPRNDVIFKSDVLLHKIAYLKGFTDKALEGLDSLMDKNVSDLNQAYLNFELWKLLPDTDPVSELHRTVALEIYTILYEKLSEYDYKLKIDELRTRKDFSHREHGKKVIGYLSSVIGAQPHRTPKTFYRKARGVS